MTQVLGSHQCYSVTQKKVYLVSPFPTIQIHNLFLTNSYKIIKNMIFLSIEQQLWTIGVDFKVKTLNVGESTVKLQLWDTAGQERFRTICMSYYRGVNGLIFCYDITNRDSFENLERWKNDVAGSVSEMPPIILVGNLPIKVIIPNYRA